MFLLTTILIAARCAPAATWTPVDTGFPSRLLGVSAIVPDPNDPSTVYAITSRALYKTIDGATTWRPVGGIAGVLSLAVDPSNSSNLYAGTEKARRLGPAKEAYREVIQRGVRRREGPGRVGYAQGDCALRKPPRPVAPVMSHPKAIDLSVSRPLLRCAVPRIDPCNGEGRTDRSSGAERPPVTDMLHTPGDATATPELIAYAKSKGLSFAPTLANMESGLI